MKIATDVGNLGARSGQARGGKKRAYQTPCILIIYSEVSITQFIASERQTLSEGDGKLNFFAPKSLVFPGLVFLSFFLSLEFLSLVLASSCSSVLPLLSAHP